MGFDIGSAVGSVVGGVADFFGQQSANRANAKLAQEAQGFSAEQFAKRYQTTVNDLQAAGLNPMLAYEQGGGSPPTAVPIATQVNPLQRAGEIASKAAGAANTAMQTQLTDASVTESYSRTGVNDANRQLIDAQIAKTIEEIPNISADTKNKLVTNLLIRAQTGATSAQEQATKQQIMIAKPEEAKAKTQWGQISPYIKDVSTGINSAVNAKQLIKGK